MSALQPRARGRARRATAAIAASALAFGGAAAMLGPGTGFSASHREAPLISNDPAADNTDVYAFVSPDKPDTVTLISNWQPFSEPAGGPNFYPFPTDARFYIKIDNDADAKPDIEYRWTFKTQDLRGLNTFLYANGPVTSLTDPNLLFRQTYTLVRENEDGTETVLVKDGHVAPSHVGKASMPNYKALRAQAIHSVAGGGKSFVGQADDPFFLDLRVFDLLYGGNLSERGSDTLTGFNVNTVALQVPISSVVSGKDPVIGVWSTTERRSMRVNNPDGSQSSSGDWVQVSRLGNPLVNEVVIPAGLKDAFNALEPVNDASVQPAVDRVLDPELARLIEAVYGIPAPKTPRDDLFAIFLTGLPGLNRPTTTPQRPAELLRLNTSIKPTADPKRLGLLAGDRQGFPNGRRLADDVVDIALQVVEGAARTGTLVEPLRRGDKVNTNDKRFASVFPYIALPHSGSMVRQGTRGERQRWDGLVPASSGATAAPAPATQPVGSAMTDAATAAAAVAPRSDTAPTWPYVAGLAGLGLAGLGVGLALRSRRWQPVRPAPAHPHG